MNIWKRFKAWRESRCSNCDSTGWVCENHADRPWDGESSRYDACGCGGAGMPCDVCKYVEGRIKATGKPWG